MASDPVVTAISEWVWTKVATNVLTGVLHRLNTIVDYYQTYRLTGTGAPSVPTFGTIPIEAVRIFSDSTSEPISATVGIDVYIMGANRDDDASDDGSIRVDV